MDWVGRGEDGGETGKNRAKIGAFAGASQPAGALSASVSARVAIWVRFGMVLSFFSRETAIPARLSAHAKTLACRNPDGKPVNRTSVYGLYL